jgi:hypothetical protein
LLKGLDKGTTETYYRVDFANTEDGVTTYLDLLHNFNTNYLLDGKFYTFSVRSNTGWRIQSVKQSTNGLLSSADTYNLKVGTTGG